LKLQRNVNTTIISKHSGLNTILDRKIVQVLIKACSRVSRRVISSIVKYEVVDSYSTDMKCEETHNCRCR
jgi:hypothetical protein